MQSTERSKMVSKFPLNTLRTVTLQKVARLQVRDRHITRTREMEETIQDTLIVRLPQIYVGIQPPKQHM